MQRTISNEISFSGKGVHTNEVSNLTLTPAKEDTGIIFRRLDASEDKSIINASYQNVISTHYCTELSNSFGTSILTVEHLLAALNGAGIDNLEIKIDGPEVPILDGSSRIFLDAINSQKEILNKPKKIIRIKEKIEITENHSYASFEPADSLEINAEINFDHLLIGKQKMELLINEETFYDELSEARTFGFLKHAEKLHSRGFGLGVNLSNAIVLTEKTIMNINGLKYDNEFIRHKILDICGDLKLAGYGIIGKYTSVCGGHNLNYFALKNLFENPNAWVLEELDDQK
ncbi:MAG: UDP-3-O-[3-hydroxymyristoyl] N-acetylglucosamine deacetylase [Rhizobiales bacterium]|nr:UDP-3-O-[3-hydroxymyristoyl] N-acetylglucosamine deacetylase [Hyphomicrobiales bacterium]